MNVPHSRSVALVALALYLAVGALTAAGAFTAIDIYSVRHLMPGLDPATTDGNSSFIDSFISFGGAHGAFDWAADLVLLPAAVSGSLLALACCCWALLQAGRALEAGAWMFAWVIASGIEVVTKELVARPGRIAGFEHSLPSGHAARAVLVASAVSSVWARAYPVAAAWALLVVPCLLVAVGAHTPIDDLAGLLLGIAFAFVVLSFLERGRSSDRRDVTMSP